MADYAPSIPWNKIRTFKQLEERAKRCGVNIERTRREYNSWKQGEDHTVALSYNLQDAIADVRDFAGLLGE